MINPLFIIRLILSSIARSKKRVAARGPTANDFLSSRIGICEHDIESKDEISGWLRRSASCSIDGKCWLNPNPEITSWCAAAIFAAANYSGHITPRDPFRAKEWKSAGTEVKSSEAIPRKNDYVILTRNGGGHIGLFAGHGKTGPLLLGGNQGNCINIQEYPEERVLGYYRMIKK